ncbi:hypothetical protein BH10PSE10_BH10PSE10_28220 [soil metagenome]
MHPRGTIVQGVAGAALAVLMIGSRAHAQAAPDTDNGRFTLSPVADGFLRLDTRTGAVSTCSNKGGWTCRLLPDERAALDSEIGRLQADNRRLKNELAQRDTVGGKTNAPLPKEDSKKSAQAPSDGKALPDKKIELQLPPEHEKLLALLDRVWDRLMEMAVRLQKRLSEKI